MPAINLRRKLYDEVIKRNLDPVGFANASTDLVLWLMDVFDIKPPETTLDKDKTEEFVEEIRGLIEELLAKVGRRKKVDA